MIATNYAKSQGPGVSSDDVMVQEGKSFSGQLTKIELEMIITPEIDINEYVCSPLFTFSSSTTQAYWYDYEAIDRDHDLNGVATSQWLKVGDKLKVTLSGIANLKEYDSQGLEKIEFEIVATKDHSPLTIGAVSPGLKAKLPYVSRSKYSVTRDSAFYAWKQVDAFGDYIEIDQPVGILKLGNDNPIEMGKTIKNPDEKISSSGGNSISGNMINGEYVITAVSTDLTLNGEKLIKTPWETFSGETKVGIVGLLFTFVGGLWTLREPILRATFPKRSQKKQSHSVPPAIGSFICEMQSGIILAGELIREPSFFFPFYILRNARRKLRASDDWEIEVIAEIRIRANLVEQSYFLGEAQITELSNRNA